MSGEHEDSLHDFSKLGARKSTNCFHRNKLATGVRSSTNHFHRTVLEWQKNNLSNGKILDGQSASLYLDYLKLQYQC